MRPVVSPIRRRGARDDSIHRARGDAGPAPTQIIRRRTAMKTKLQKKAAAPAPSPSPLIPAVRAGTAGSDAMPPLAASGHDFAALPIHAPGDGAVRETARAGIGGAGA